MYILRALLIGGCTMLLGVAGALAQGAEPQVIIQTPVTPYASAVGGATPFHALSAASNNATSLKQEPGTVYDITIIQTTTTLGDFRLYDTAANPPTCSSATGVVANYALQSNATTPGLHLTFPLGKAFANGIGFCLTGAVADNDNSNFVTGVQINVDYK